MKRLSLLLILALSARASVAQPPGGPRDEMAKSISTRSDGEAGVEEGTEQTSASTFVELQKQAREGNVDAMVKVAECYFEGIETTADPVLGFKASLSAANAGSQEAMFQAGQCYLDGIGTPKRITDGMSWLKRAADNGNSQAARRIAMEYERIHRRTTSKAEQLFKACKNGAEMGDSYCQRLLGICYETAIGTDADDQRALQWYERAMNAGDADAIIAAARCYARGKGVACDLPKALHLLGKEAKKGSVAAMGELASVIDQFILRGSLDLLEKDPLGIASHCAEIEIRARYERLVFEYLENAATAGHTPSMNRLAERLSQMNGNKLNLDRAFELAKESASREDVEGQCLLANFHRDGIGTKPSVKKAFSLYEKAAKHGSGVAQFYYGQSLITGTGVLANPLRGVQWIKKSAENGCAEAIAFIEDQQRQARENGSRIQRLHDFMNEVITDSINSASENSNRIQQALDERFRENHGFR